MSYCEKCRTSFRARKKDYIWDDNGLGYSTKLVRCPKCNNWIIVEIIEDYAMSVLSLEGLDYRYYEYKKRSD